MNSPFSSFRAQTIQLLLSLFIVVSCGRPATEAVKKSLMTTMEEYLNKPASNGNTVHFQVLEVTYYDDKVNYQCEFRVRMKSVDKDTTGMMGARISNDFQQVTRKK